MPHLLTLPKELRDKILTYSIECSSAELGYFLPKRHTLPQPSDDNDPRAWVFSYGEPYCRSSCCSWPDCVHVYEYGDHIETETNTVPANRNSTSKAKVIDHYRSRRTQPALLVVNHQLRDEFLPLLASHLDFSVSTATSHTSKLSEWQILPTAFTENVRVLKISRAFLGDHNWVLNELASFDKLEKVIIDQRELDSEDLPIFDWIGNGRQIRWTAEKVLQSHVTSAVETRMKEAFEYETAVFMDVPERRFKLEVTSSCERFWVEREHLEHDDGRTLYGNTFVSYVTVSCGHLLS